VKVLLEKNDVNPNKANKYGQTALLWAVQHRQEGIVRLLLKRTRCQSQQSWKVWPNSALIGCGAWAGGDCEGTPGTE